MGWLVQGTEIARRWDQLYGFLIVLSIFFFVGIVAAMIYFTVKFREKPGVKATYITHHHLLEFIWTIIPTILLMIIFAWGWVVYRDMVQPPSDAYEIRVIGKQWLWQFQYDDGRSSIGDLYVPANTPVRLVMTSEDVLHSFFIPNFRVKQDVVPGMYTSVWFEAKVLGVHQIYCAEYCGASHSGMLGKVIVLDDQQWKDWKKGKTISVPGMSSAAAGAGGSAPTLSLADQGKQVFQSKGCVACHSDDGSAKVGPTLKGAFGHEVELADGKKVTVDENYIRESIENPTAKVVKGFAPTMPVFKGLISETELNSLIAYIKGLK